MIGLKALYRVYQGARALAQQVLPAKKTSLTVGNGSFLAAAVLLGEKGVRRVQIVTTAGSVRRGTVAPLLDALEKEGVEASVYDGVAPDPDISCVEQAAERYREDGCDAFLALGGGSAIDCAKLAAARVARPELSVEKMKGTLKIRAKLPYIVAIPTTAGTGSEVTPAAVVTDAARGLKFPVADLCLVPDAAILDPSLTVGLSPAQTAQTAFDAFTHAIEAYTNCFATKRARAQALDAIKLISENLYAAYLDGTNLPAREHLLLASFYAGQAFSSAYVGYVHAIAHALGGMYHIPHGEACAIVLPVVLVAYGSRITPKLARVADHLMLGGGSDGEKAQLLLQRIVYLERKTGIPATVAQLREEDIPLLARRALKEANPAYPVPVIWDREMMESVLKKLLA